MRLSDLFSFKRPKQNKEFIKSRRCGRSTRIMDASIQHLFTTGSVLVQDHFNTHESSVRLVRMIKQRLFSEHGMRDKVHYSITGLTIRLKK